MGIATELSRALQAMGAAAALTILTPGAAAAQITAQPLGGLDLFQAGARRADVPEDVWRGTSAVLAAEVFDRLDDGAVSRAARDTALALLGASAAAPDGAATDVALAAARVRTLLALGDAAAADSILDRTAGVANSAPLSEVAAEAALFTGQDEDACRVGSELQDGTDGAYWMRLRAYCDAIGGRGPAALLGLNLLDGQDGRDEVFARLMNALIAGEGANAGAASLRTGLHTALSRRLALDLAPALERAAIAALPTLATAGPESVRAAAAERALALGLIAGGQGLEAAAQANVVGQEIQGEFGLAVAEGLNALASEGEFSGELVDRLARLARTAEGAARSRAQRAALLLAAAGAPVPAEHRAALIRWEAGNADAAGARRLGLDLAADAGRPGEAALVALDIAAGAGATGPKLSDRLQIVRALRKAGLPQWRLWAREGLEQIAFPPATR